MDLLCQCKLVFDAIGKATNGITATGGTIVTHHQKAKRLATIVLFFWLLLLTDLLSLTTGGTVIQPHHARLHKVAGIRGGLWWHVL